MIPENTITNILDGNEDDFKIIRGFLYDFIIVLTAIPTGDADSDFLIRGFYIGLQVRY